MQRQREHAGIVFENAGGAVALVHVQVDHRDLQRCATFAILSTATTPFGLHHPCGHSHVIEDTKAAALVGIGMVGAASQVGCDSVCHCAARCGNGGPH